VTEETFIKCVLVRIIYEGQRANFTASLLDFLPCLFPLTVSYLCRSKENSTIRRLLLSKQKHSSKNEMLGSENSVLEPSDVSPFFSIEDLSENDPTRPRTPLAPPPPSESVPSVTPPVSPNAEQTGSQKSKSNTSLAYALIGAAIFSVVLSLSAAIFLCYRRRKTSSVVPLSSSRQLQTETTIVGG
jgi:hypothetical protein